MAKYYKPNADKELTDKLNTMFRAITASHLSLGVTYLLIDRFELAAYILGYVIALTAVELFVIVRHHWRDRTFYRILSLKLDAQPQRTSKDDEAAMYAYFVICLKRGDKPGKRTWLGRGVPGHPHISITLKDWRQLTRHARYDGHLKYGGRGVGWINLAYTPPTSAETSRP